MFTKAAAFWHASIPSALRAVRELGAQNGLVVDATEDAADFTPANLARYEALVFLLTTGDVLNAAQQAAFERFIRSGGGYAGVHSATDTEYGWPWYGDLVGARFRNHPHIQAAATMHFDGTTGRARTAALPRGRWRFSVVLTDPKTGVSHSARRSVRVP